MSDEFLESLLKDVTPKNDKPWEEFLLAIAVHEAGHSQKQEILTSNQESLLASIGRFPCIDRSEREEKLGWNANTMQNAIDSLKNQDFIDTQTMKKGGRGSGFTVFILTDKAKSYMQKRNIHFQPLHGNGKHHCLIELWIKEKESNGFKTELQVIRGEFIFDALATKDISIGLEAVGSDNLQRDLKKFPQLLLYVDHLEVVFTDADLGKEYQRRFKTSIENHLYERMSFKAI